LINVGGEDITLNLRAPPETGELNPRRDGRRVMLASLQKHREFSVNFKASN